MGIRIFSNNNQEILCMSKFIHMKMWLGPLGYLGMEVSILYFCRDHAFQFVS